VPSLLLGAMNTSFNVSGLLTVHVSVDVNEEADCNGMNELRIFAGIVGGAMQGPLNFTSEEIEIASGLDPGPYTCTVAVVRMDTSQTLQTLPSFDCGSVATSETTSLPRCSKNNYVRRRT